MIRDWDIIRDILSQLEDKPAEKHSLCLDDFNKEKQPLTSYNIELLIEAGLVCGSMSKTIGGTISDFIALRLTWEGHEFLDTIRSDSVWNKTKASFMKQGLSMTVELIKSVATSIATELLKKQLNY